MKRLSTLLFTTLILFSSCGNKAEKLANEKLEVAKAAFARGDYDEAKRQIDSIKILYPKAFDAREASQKLLMEVELKSQGSSLEQLDSLMQIKIKQFDQIRNKYTFEKDTAYQSMGNFLYPTQVVEKNMHRSFLRFQVNEQGIMSMTSIYCGKGNIHHSAVKVTAPDGTSAETPRSKDQYETTDMGEKIEKADYIKGQDGGVMAFLYEHKGQNIRVELKGDKSYTTTMSPSDREALVGIYELADLLYGVEKIKKEQEKANLKINFVNKKKAFDSSRQRPHEKK